MESLDNLDNSGIMTSEWREHASYKRDNESSDSPGTGVSAERREPAISSSILREGEPSEGIQGTGQGRRPSGISGNESERLQEVGSKHDRERGIRESSLEYGDTLRDTGVRERLDEPHDITLRSNEDIGANMGAAARFDANLSAIRTLKTIESERRTATPEEQSILAKYSGFGDSQFNPAFQYYYGRDNDAWKRRGEALKELTSEDEYKAIKGSRLNAFYTTPDVIKAMWQGLERLGANNLNSPHVLEPSAGSGRFLGFQPNEMAARSKRTAVELDSLTGRILKQAYPQSDVYVTGYESAPLPKDSFDIAISNVPFGNYAVFDPSFKKQRAKLKTQIHNYFFAKTLERLRPGGVLAFITTHGTLDAPGSKPQREMMAQEADFVGAIRLPRKAFPDTDVVTDIIYMRKRAPGDLPGDTSWTGTQEIELQGEYDKVKRPVNNYFIQHPEMVLGQHTAKGSMRGSDEYTVELFPGAELTEKLSSATTRLPQGIVRAMPPLPPRSVYSESSINVRDNSRVVDKDGTVRIKRNGMLEKADFNENESERVRQMLRIRDNARKVLDIQLREGTEEEIASAQKELNAVYNSFTEKYGALRNKENVALMKGDTDGPFLMALEKGEPSKKEDADTWRSLIKAKKLNESERGKLKMPLFSGRTVKGLGFRDVNNVKDAMTVAYNETGRLDFGRMSGLLNKSEDEVIRELANSGDIFKNPVGTWEIASEYLSGDVRQKLRDAELAADANPRYKPNVEALKKAQPADLKPSEISVSLGAPWIPSKDVNDFVRELLRTNTWRDKNNYFAYNPHNGQWIVGDKIDAPESSLKSLWGTDRMPANKIIERVLNGQLVEVKDKDTNDEGKEISVRNGPATIAAQEKAEAIERKFREWLWHDDERAERLAKYYNETYNCRCPRYYDGSHLEFPGMSEQWVKQIHDHQKDAVWRGVQDRTALLAHEVGFGKTAVMVTTAMRLRQLGLARKNLFVVPKPTHAQFQAQFAEIYPYANVLAPTDDDFTPANRARFVSSIATGDWDAVILTSDQFRRIPVKPETEARFLQDEIDAFRAALEQSKQSSDDDDDLGYYRRRTPKDKAKEKTQKQIEASIKSMEVKLKNLQTKSKEIGDKTIYFEDLGVDQLFVDEADNFKNLQFATQMGRLKGLPNSHSDRAWDMYGKTRYLQEKGKGNGVIFATGTPVANTIAEMYTMMRYLQEPMLESKGLQHFDAWAKTFGETTETLEQTPTGAYKMTQRFAKFQNAPELSQLWQEVADIRVADEVPAIARIRPRLVDDNGKPRRTVVPIKPDDALERYMKSLVERADNLKNVSPHQDNMLKLSNDARKAALDVRMVDPTAPGNPNGKVATAAKNVSRIYDETTTDKGTQLIFLDLGTPKAKDKIDENGDEPTVTVDGVVDDEEETAEEKRLLEDVYNNLRDALIAEGVPRDKIAFIHDAKTDKQKIMLQERTKAGDIRVVIGSTAKLGTGVNVQERAAALHHLDCPWRPRDIEQREGRIIRQGNKVYGPKIDESGNIIDPGKGVRIYTYVTEQSFDGYMWQAVEAKSKAIKSIMRRENPPRSIDDCDSFTMSASEAKAIASGNPDVLKQVSLKNAAMRLQMARSSHMDAQLRAKEQVRKLPQEIEQLENQIAYITKDAAKAGESKPFSLNVKGVAVAERPDASEALKDAIESMPMGEQGTVAKFKGFDIEVTNNGAAAGYAISVTNPDTGTSYNVSSGLPYHELTTGILTRVENVVKKIPNELETAKNELNKNKISLKTYEQQATAPFEHDERLKNMEKELDRLARKLQGEDVGEGASDLYVDDDLPDETPSYHYGQREKAINPQAEIQAVKAEVEQVDKGLDVQLPAPNIEKVVEKIGKPVELKSKGMPATSDIDIAEEYERFTREQADVPKGKKGEPETAPVEPAKPKVIDMARGKGYIPKGITMPPLPAMKKEPWQMTKEEFEEANYQGDDVTGWNDSEAKKESDRLLSLSDTLEKEGNKQAAESAINQAQAIAESHYEDNSHEVQIKRAVKSGKKIPPDVLTDYPEIRKLKASAAKKGKPAPKKKPAEDGTVYSISELQVIHDARTPRSKAMDEAQAHGTVIKPDDTRVERWVREPGSADIEGIDTKKQKYKITYEPDKSNKKPKAPKPPRPRAREGRGIDLGGGVVQDGRRRHITTRSRYKGK